MERPDYDVSEQDWAELVDGENAEAAKPIAAEIVGPVTVREFPARSWFGGQAAVNTTPQQIAGHLPQRTRLMIYNTGPNTVYLAASLESCTPTSSYPLPVNTGAEFRHTAAVYAVCATGDTATLALGGEFRDAG